MLSTVPSHQASQTVSLLGSVQSHYTPIWPRGFCESWCCRKSTRRSEMWNNRLVFTGPNGSLRLVHHTGSESHTPHSHPFFKCFPASLSQCLTNSLLLYQFRKPPSEMCHHHLCHCCIVLFFPLSARKMNGTGECWFVCSLAGTRI